MAQQPLERKTKLNFHLSCSQISLKRLNSWSKAALSLRADESFIKPVLNLFETSFIGFLKLFWTFYIAVPSAYCAALLIVGVLLNLRPDSSHFLPFNLHKLCHKSGHNYLLCHKTSFVLKACQPRKRFKREHAGPGNISNKFIHFSACQRKRKRNRIKTANDPFNLAFKHHLSRRKFHGPLKPNSSWSFIFKCCNRHLSYADHVEVLLISVFVAHVESWQSIRDQVKLTTDADWRWLTLIGLWQRAI